jgi:hypothetical protein
MPSTASRQRQTEVTVRMPSTRPNQQFHARPSTAHSRLCVLTSAAIPWHTCRKSTLMFILNCHQVSELVAPYPDTFAFVNSWLWNHGVSSSSQRHSAGTWLTVIGVPVYQVNYISSISIPRRALPFSARLASTHLRGPTLANCNANDILRLPPHGGK